MGNFERMTISVVVLRQRPISYGGKFISIELVVEVDRAVYVILCLLATGLAGIR